jgi:penicillin-binding protein 1B
LALQQAVSEGTGRALLSDGLGRLSAAGKTGTSNDSRDSWFAGWTGDHLAVIWVGNDQNKPTGLYGATGAMRVWSGLFARLPSAPLRVPTQGLEWHWIGSDGSTDAGCPGARQIAFVAGFAPAYQPCVMPEDTFLESVEAAEQSGVSGFFNRLFGRDRDQAPPPPDDAPPEQTP